MIELRPYQISASNFLLRCKRGILGDEMGLGKTLSAMHATFNNKPFRAKQRILIPCSKNAMYTWKKEFAKWYPEYSSSLHFIRGNKNKRAAIWAMKEPGIYIVSYGTLRNDIEVMPKEWDHIIADEAHSLRNKKTATFKAFKKLRSPTIYFITGTPASRNRGDLWTMFHLIDRKTFSSYWKFIDTFCTVEFGAFGRDIVGTRNDAEFEDMCRTMLLVRKMKDVDKELPIKIRTFPETELDRNTRRIYNEMRDEMVSILNEETGAILISSSVLGVMTKLRQLLACPKILDESLPVGAGFEWICEHRKENELKYATVFCMYPSAFLHFRKHLEDKGVNVFELRGGMELEDIERETTAFERDGGVMLASIKFAQSYSMQWCTTGYVLGYSFDPQENYQAESRLLRMNTIGNVNLFYVKHLDTYDERVLEVLDEKQQNVASIYKTPEQYMELFE